MVLAAGTVLVIGILLAQEYAVLKGRVSDGQGHALSRAVLILKNVQTGRIYQTISDNKGYYEFIKIPSGVYSLQVKCSGYQSFLKEKILLEGGITKTFDPKMTPLPPHKAKDEGGVLGGVVAGVVGEVEEASAIYARRTRLPSEAYRDFNTEEYSRIYENRYLLTADNPLSTFSIDVDTASYANIRRFIKSNRFPPKDAVRIEEMVNYFNYDYPQPKGRDPFSISTEYTLCPWNNSHKLVLLGLKGKELAKDRLPPANLVFLIDVSGSMKSANKLSLLKPVFRLLVSQLGERDRVSIVVYAGAAGLVLPPTSGVSKEKIFQAIDQLEAGGSTAGGAGIRLAYKTAHEHFIQEGNNRIILATDGDFNVGISSTSELVRMVEEEKDKGVFLTVLGFGMGNYKDSRLEQLADKGNGNFYYIDSMLEAKKVFVDDLRGTLFTIAKDVKIQVEFNPAKVKAYRLVGYENRLLKNEDFKDDTKDAGELGAGHRVTVLYEIIPFGSKEEILSGGELKYQENSIKPEAFKSKEVLTVKLRYKKPDGKKSHLLVSSLENKEIPLKKASLNFKFAAAVAEFGLLLRDSKFKGISSFEQVLDLARQGRGDDRNGYRAEFIQMVELCSLLSPEKNG
ncbi:MAG: von Willebrand factor type A domain-containing protein [Candidatus Aminicenantes bacterium]|nr:von Willebrand factor type A domain-containing protein [Candidatus Aminicenantes bacterium]